MTEFKILKQFDLQKTLNQTLPNSWDKIRIEMGWEAIGQRFRNCNNSVFIGNRLVSQEVYDDFSKFIDPKTLVNTQRGRVAWENITLQDNINHAWYDKNNPSNIMLWFYNAKKMFKDNSAWLVSQEAYEFLKKYIGNQNLNIRYSPNQTFPYKEFARDRIILNDQVEIISQTSNNQVIDQLQQQIIQLQQTIDSLNQQLAQSNNTNAQLQQANQALQNQVNELNAIINGGTGEEIADRAVMMRSKTQLEAKVEQPTNLPPK